jgi:transposase
VDLAWFLRHRCSERRIPLNRLHVRALTAAERTTLAQWARSGKSAWYHRARTILLAADTGACGSEIAASLGLHPNTTCRWLGAFTHGGLAALAPRRRGGRLRQLGAELAEVLIVLLHDPATAHGGAQERWTLREVAAALVREGQVAAISSETLRRLLKSRKHSWQRAKEWLSSPDPQYARKKSGASAS